MAEARVERRLAAILAGDVAGYSRLMGADEEGTLRQLKVHRKELVDPKITEHRGRIVKTTGDGMLVEFVSVVDAVRCAVEIQRGMAERNSDVAVDRRIEFRIGINVGDIISDANDIYGDGVNVAARLEALAEPGGIMVSRSVYDQVRDKLSFSFEDLIPVENPALQAVLMALDMRTAIGGMIEKWRDLGHDLGFGIGIAHGFATLGTIGFEGRFDYAAIGTVSNVASRLCDEAKPGQILISPRVRLAVDKAVTVEPVGEFTLKGIRRPMMTCNVLSFLGAKRN